MQPTNLPSLNIASLEKQLATISFGRSLEYYPTIDSTNNLLRERARAGAAEGLLITTDEQTAGRGRLGRSWAAPFASSILASLLLRPNIAPDEAFAPTMILGLAVQQSAIAFGAPAVLKWPNDVLVEGRKLCGILCEVALSSAGADKNAGGVWVVAGFGVNVNFDPDEYNLQNPATSFSRELKRNVEREALLARILLEAEQRYFAWQNGSYKAVWSEWRENLSTLGRQVRVEIRPGEIIAGEAVDVAPDGALLLRTATAEHRVVSGVIEVL